MVSIFKQLEKFTVRQFAWFALEGNFRFVLDKSDLKSPSVKNFVGKATVARENKICEQNTMPCCERLAIEGDGLEFPRSLNM